MSTTVLPACPVRLSTPPALEVVRQRALDMMLSGAPLHAELAQLVEVDAPLTGLLLRLARCPVYDTHGDDALDIADAMERVGREALSHAIQNLPRLPRRQFRESVEQACRDWVHGLAVAASARWLASTGAYEDLDEAYVAGLVHDAGRHCGGDDRDASARTEATLRRWRLPERVVVATRFHARVRDGIESTKLAVGGRPLDAVTRSLLDVVARADALATAAGYGDSRSDGEAAAAVVDAADVVAVTESIKLELAHAAALLGLEAGDSAELVRLLTNEEVRLGESEPERPLLAATDEQVVTAHANIVAARDLMQVHQIVATGLREIRIGLGFDRVLLFDIVPPDGRLLRGRAVSDASDLVFSAGLRAVTVELADDGVLRQVLDGAPGRPGLCTGSDDAARRLLGVSSFACARLLAGNAPIGLVVADRFFADLDVDQRDARRLLLLCDSLGLVLENVVLDLQGRKLRALAEKDELTGINNRRNIVRMLHSEMERARRFGKPLSLALLDVDNFKRWNDAHGHHVGDIVLQAVAQLIASCSREIDHYGRYGGEEFLVVLPETSVQHAVLYAERLRVSLESQCAEMFADYPSTPVSVSIGVTSLDEGDSPDDMVRRADTALYAAKKHGRNRVCIESR